MDPLTLLRDFVTQGHADQVQLVGDRVDYGGRYSFPKAVRTSYKSEQGKKDFYDLESLLFFVRHLVGSSTKYMEYYKAAKQSNLTPVSFLDRKVRRRRRPAGRAVAPAGLPSGSRHCRRNSAAWRGPRASRSAHPGPAFCPACLPIRRTWRST